MKREKKWEKKKKNKKIKIKILKNNKKN